MIGGNRNITINEQDFSKKLIEISEKFICSPIDVLKFGAFCGELHGTLFGDTESEKPLKKGDKVFVIDNEGDGNRFVNKVATVIEVYNDNSYEVMNGTITQSVRFENLRKVEP